MVVRDADGKILSDTGQKPSKSFVLQFLEFFYLLFTAPGGYTTRTDVTGNNRNFYRDVWQVHDHLRADAPINNSNYGIVVGTGDTAKDNEDHKLETQLTEGVGAGNITHGVMVITPTAIVGANVDLELTRAFTNNTGSLITVKEAGMYIGQIYPPPYYFCIIRDVLVLSTDVPDKCSLTVYYTVRTTVTM